MEEYLHKIPDTHLCVEKLVLRKEGGQARVYAPLCQHAEAGAMQTGPVSELTVMGLTNVVTECCY